MLADFLEFLLNLVGDRLDLPRIRAGANDESVREGGDVPHIQDGDLSGLFRLSSVDSG